MVYKFFDKKTCHGTVKDDIMSNKKSAELHKPIIRKFDKTLISIPVFYRQYLGCWSSWYAID